MTENACQLVFERLSQSYCIWWLKLYRSCLWVRYFSVKVRQCLGACAVAVALRPQEGGLCLTPLAQQHLTSAVTVATLLCCLPINPWPGWPSPVLLLFSVYLTESLSKNRRKMSLGTRIFFTWSVTIRLLYSGFPVFLFLFPVVFVIIPCSFFFF